MGKRNVFVAVTALLAAGLALSGCSTPSVSSTATTTAPPAATSSAAPVEPTSAAPTTSAAVNQESTVSVLWNQPMYAYNNMTSFGNATANANIIYMTSAGFAYYDKDLNITPDKSFGTFEKVSDDPLKIKMTFADTAQWSDGVPVSAADFIVNFGAQSGLWNTGEVQTDENGNTLANADGTVAFDASSVGYALVTDFPEISADGKTVTITYSKPFADWLPYMVGPIGLPAHIIGKRALGIDDPAQANQAVIDAFKNKDNAALSKIANVWNMDWNNFTTMPTDPDLLVCAGPFQISNIVENQYLTVKRNPNYKGAFVPKVDSVTVRYNEDPTAAIQALQNNEVQLIQPQATADSLLQVKNLGPNFDYSTSEGGTYEHVDLTMNNGGPFDAATYGGDEAKATKVRQAFLLTVPRNDILDKIIRPINPNAQIRNAFNVVPGSPNYDATIAANGMKDTYGDNGDVEKAKQLLADAGVTNPTVRILYGKSNVRRQQEFQLISEMATQAGFTIVDNGDDKWGQKLGDGSYDASIFGWQSTGIGVTEPAANYITTPTPGINNFGGLNSPEVDKLYQDLNVTLDPAKQTDINIQVEKILVNVGFGITIFQFPEITAYSKSLHNVSSIPLSPTVFWNFWEWTIS